MEQSDSQAPEPAAGEDKPEREPAVRGTCTICGRLVFDTEERIKMNEVVLALYWF